MSRKKKQPSPLTSLFTKQPKTNRVKKGAIAGAAVGAAVALAVKQKKSQP
jgi:hypothetical protein